MMDWGDVGWSWWWMLPMMIMMVMFVGAIVWAAIALTRPNDSTVKSVTRKPDDILKERFARGEIDAAEYRERSDALHGAAPLAKR